MELGPSQRFLSIFSDQDRIVVERDLGRHAFKSRLAQGVNIPCLILVVVFVLPQSGFLRLQPTQSCDVNVETRPPVDPPRIDNVEALAPFALSSPGVDVEEVAPLNVGVSSRVVDDGLVEAVSQVQQGGIRYLSIDIPVPG